MQIISDGSNNVRSSMFECSKPKIGVRFQMPKDEDVQCPVQTTFSEQTLNVTFQV